ncbi:TRAP transporter small permease [Candidatus Aerophobetes bacterium]|nr:TRAP transporter small permease [Candidatus Aerophobetes bacterium]
MGGRREIYKIGKLPTAFAENEKKLKKFIQCMEKLQSWILITFLIILVVAVSMQVFNRFVIKISMPFLQMVVMFCVSWMTFLGAGLGIRDELHFGIDIIPNLLTGKARTYFKLAIYSVVMVSVGFLAESGVAFIHLSLLKKSPSTGLPMVITYSSVFVGAVVAFIYVFLRIYRFFRKEKGENI